jgi:hypothetical protein
VFEADNWDCGTMIFGQNSRIDHDNQDLKLCLHNDAARIEPQKQNIRLGENNESPSKNFLKILNRFSDIASSRSIGPPICNFVHLSDSFGVLIE